MNECSLHDPLLDRTACIVTYGGNVADMWINYVTLVLTLAISFYRARNTLGNIPEHVLQRRWLWSTMAALPSVCFFQIALCWIVGCTGISIIWCAMAGWVINERKRHAQPGDVGQPTAGRTLLEAGEDVTLTIILGVVVYYAITTAPITSVAHFCALILGTLVSRINRRLVLVKSQMYEMVIDEPRT